MISLYAPRKRRDNDFRAIIKAWCPRAWRSQVNQSYSSSKEKQLPGEKQNNDFRASIKA